ncbi:zinc finger MYM-type protein 4-like, partial [Stegodyphus dumicola]|uniref:zinc finger MYM-type protein 4-like n=1 Tax=Stegodyphus dumicola TaxID=202533 RepID=UPI0015ABFA2D
IADKEAVNEKTVAKDKKHGANTKESKSEGSKKDGESSKKKKSKICEECGAKKGLKFQVLFQGKTRFLCSDTCFKNFKTKQKAGKSATEEAPSIPSSVPAAGDKCGQCQKEFQAGQGYYPVIGEVKPLCSEDCIKKYYEGNEPPRKCSQCKKDIEDLQNLLTWETMDFCNENCLGKYQSYLGSHCTCCQSPVQQSSLGKYCVCFGADIRQFCSGSCLEDFKKGLKVCSFCQTDLSAGIDGFLAPVGDKGQFKDFCSQRCMERYEIMNNISKTAPQSQECFHCKKQGSFKIQVKHEDKSYSLCCDNCVAGFRCSFKIKENMCDTCYKFFKPIADEFSLKLDGLHKHFCTKACMTLFVLSHRKIVPCIWCKVKKYNFDMIEKTDGNGQTQVFCSLNCLSVYRVSLNATSSKSIRCDNCAKNLPAQYHLTMSDGSIRNFCTYQCCIYFQNQFTNVPALTTTSTTRQTSTSAQAAKTTASATSSPVISNVISLASATRSVAPGLVNKLVPQKLVTARQQGPVTVIAPKSQNASSTITSPSTSNAMASTSGTQVVREVVVKPPAPKSVKNKTVSCKPIMQTKGVSCKPHPCHKAVQTDESPKPIFFPIPVPVYVPTPLHMFSRPVPCPVPFPVPIPIPIMVATSKESPSQVIKHLKDIQEKIPSNPYEAELLMMAEMVAEDGSKTQKEQNLPEETNNNKTNEEKPPTENNIQTSEPVSQELVCVDVTQEQNVPNAESEVEDEYAFKDNKSHHSKRSAGSHGRKGRKKAKVDEIPVEEVESNAASALNEDQNTTCQNDHPETYARLKHTFGVNAWKQWVLEKNMQMEKGSQSSRKFKLFKTDLLQLPPDELNYSLSLFVKEVRKPSGDRYCSGSIYYLCL